MHIIVTGSSGKAGRATVKELLAYDYRVTGVDLTSAPADLNAPSLQADLTDLGQALEVLTNADAVVHLANIPAPDLFTPGRTFAQNITMNYNVFSAATQLKAGGAWCGPRVRPLWACLSARRRATAPVDEAHYPVPESSYALSKVASETVAEQFARWSGLPFIGLRLSNILDPEAYRQFPDYWGDAALRRWNLWGYVDERDVAQACRVALKADLEGSESFIIAAADTVMNRPSWALMEEVFPGVEVADGPERVRHPALHQQGAAATRL